MGIWNAFTMVLGNVQIMPTEQAAQVAQDAANGTQQIASGPMDIVMLLVPILMLVVVWFLMMRPQRKREKEMAEMQSAMKVGENVLTSAGLYGKIVSIGHDSFVVEFGAEGGGRGVRIPVRKSDIVGIKTPVMTPPPIETADTKGKKKK